MHDSMQHTPNTSTRLAWLGGKVGLEGADEGSPEKVGEFIKQAIELMNDPEYRNGPQARQISRWIASLQSTFEPLVKELERKKGVHDKTLPSRVVEGFRGLSTLASKTAYSSQARGMKPKKQRAKLMKKGKAGRKPAKLKKE